MLLVKDSIFPVLFKDHERQEAQASKEEGQGDEKWHFNHENDQCSVDQSSQEECHWVYEGGVVRMIFFQAAENGLVTRIQQDGVLEDQTHFCFNSQCSFLSGIKNVFVLHLPNKFFDFNCRFRHLVICLGANCALGWSSTLVLVVLVLSPSNLGLTDAHDC